MLSKPLNEAAARETVLYSVCLERWRDAIPAELGALGGEIIGNAAITNGLSLLVALPGATPQEQVKSVFATLGAGDLRIAEAGSHAARYSFGS